MKGEHGFSDMSETMTANGRADLPKVKFGHPVPVRFKAIPHRALNPLRVGNSVHQYLAGGARNPVPNCR